MSGWLHSGDEASCLFAWGKCSQIGAKHHLQVKRRWDTSSCRFLGGGTGYAVVTWSPHSLRSRLGKLTGTFDDAYPNHHTAHAMIMDVCHAATPISVPVSPLPSLVPVSSSVCLALLLYKWPIFSHIRSKSHQNASIFTRLVNGCS